MSRLIPSLIVGLLVNFVLPADCTHAGEIRPAVIVRVNSTTEPYSNCNLSVLRDGGNDPDVLPWYGTIRFDQEGKKPGTFHFAEHQMLPAEQPLAAPLSPEPVAIEPAICYGGKRASSDAIAKASYAAYCADAGGVSLVSGQPLPKWEELDLKIRHAWVVASEAAIAAEWIDPEPVKT